MRTVRGKAIFRRKTILLRRMVTGSRRNISKRMITTAGIPTTNPRKKENTTDGSIRTGNVQNNLILNVISRRRTKPLRKDGTGVSWKQKLDRLQNKAEKAGKKTEAARKKIPKKKEYSFERVFDEKTGKAKYVLTAVEKEKAIQTG